MFVLDVTDAKDRDDLIQVFAEYKIVPKRNPHANSDIAKSQYIFERRGNPKPGSKKHPFGTKTRKKKISEIGITSDEECERVREEIKNHPNWGDKA
jgi:hypothetical protein